MLSITKTDNLSSKCICFFLKEMDFTNSRPPQSARVKRDQNKSGARLPRPICRTQINLAAGGISIIPSYSCSIPMCVHQTTHLTALISFYSTPSCRRNDQQHNFENVAKNGCSQKELQKLFIGSPQFTREANKTSIFRITMNQNKKKSSVPFFDKGHGKRFCRLTAP